MKESTDENLEYYLLALLNSTVANYFFELLNPSFHLNVGDVLRLPIIIKNSKENIIKNTHQLIQISIEDWNSFETSWEFISSPVLNNINIANNLKDSLNFWQKESKLKFDKAIQLETEINEYFIDAYQLQDELDPKVQENQITLSKSDINLEIKRLISYSTGCTMGRFSLDEPGLVYVHSSNKEFDPLKYKTFPADDDGIVPIMDMDWFEDDATKRFIEFIKTAWSEETLDENLKFIADSLKPKTSESPEETIRRYLSTTFFKDHMKTYKKRPIYWLFSSGKQKAFECLAYLHRYNVSTLSRMRSNYVTPLQGNISARIEFLKHEKDATTTASAQKKIQKQIDVLKKKQVELKNFDDELRHYADMRISIDLDDGVKVNYGKFGNLLAERKAITRE